MARSQVDSSIERVAKAGFSFPLGVYPVEEFAPVEGYLVEFEPSDGGDEPGDWEEWPDRYLFDIVVSAARLQALARMLLALLPGRVYPILDVLGNDAYREVDPYIAYDPVGIDRFLEGVHRHREWLYEDGLVGFGAMCDDPFIYVYIDEHKIITIRVQTDMRERVERILTAFDLAVRDEPVGVDAAVHEHRGVLHCPPEDPQLLAAEEIVEELVEAWRLRLNVDAENNVDDAGRELGVTAWRCIVRGMMSDDGDGPMYVECLLTAGSRHEAEEMAFAAAEAALADANGSAHRAEPTATDAGEDDSGLTPELAVILADRATPEQFTELLGEAPTDDLSTPRLVRTRVLAG